MNSCTLVLLNYLILLFRKWGPSFEKTKNLCPKLFDSLSNIFHSPSYFVSITCDSALYCITNELKAAFVTILFLYSLIKRWQHHNISMEYLIDSN